jgi:hypothetical protein
MSTHRAAASIRCVALSLAAVLFAGGDARGEENDPYLVPKEEVQRKVRTIALTPVVLPAGTEDPEPVRQLFESLLVQKLQRKGFTTVPSAEFASTWLRMSERLGGVYDPLTGEPREGQYDAAWEHTTRELARRFSADAVLQPVVGPGDWIPGVKLALPREYYAILGEAITWRGKPIFASAPNFPQKLRGVALGVRLFDLTGAPMYAYSAGIEWYQVYIARSREDRPRREMYASAERNQGAVDRALDSLISVGQPATPP